MAATLSPSDDVPPATYGCSPALLLSSAPLARSVAAVAASAAGVDAATAAAAAAEGATTAAAAAAAAVVPISAANVHPLVLLSVLDHHTRRQEGAGRVIGTLLGKRDGDTVEVTNAFAVPHAERGDEVAIGKDFNRQMLALHLRANPRETVVGWYATALPPDEDADDDADGGGSSPTTTGEHRCIADTSSLIHEFYAGECDDDPVHLVVDASLKTDAIGLRAYKSSPVRVGGEPLANVFHEMRLSVASSESERICVDRMIGGASSAPGVDASMDEGAALRTSMGRLLGMLETCSAYVDGVVDGKITPDDEVGREISETLSSVPRIRPEAFDRMFDDSLQDLLMVTYLSNITKTQLTIAEKLNETLGK